ncbi:Crp/Fnr family transcriptional regulator [Longilinea arvoryzae]|nr:cyclic nucleotide-binding domain-containing protein [Longilinea arvoryzae]
MFSQLTGQALAEVEGGLKPRSLAAGEVLFNQGDPGDELILVTGGKLAIYAPEDGFPARGQPIRLFTDGSMLGEMALIDHQPRSLSARAEEPSTILALSRGDFERLMDENSILRNAIMAGLSERIRYTTDFLGEVRQWVQRITEGNYQAGIEIDTGRRFKDPSLAVLAAEFSKMAAQVKEREDTLKQEVAMLRIEIDETKRKEDASQIMNSDYYRSLKARVNEIRHKKE